MFIRHTEPDDLRKIIEIYENARAFMRKTGNLTQWGEGDNPIKHAADDIRDGLSYVCCEGSEILAVFVFLADAEDPTYKVISDGAWKECKSYGVIHRIAVAAQGKDVAGFCFDWCAARCDQLRIDTHADNRPMQRALAKNGFTRCGIIQTFDGTDRTAFSRDASYTIAQNEPRRKKLFAVSMVLWAIAAALAAALAADIFRALDVSRLWLIPLFALLMLPGYLTINARLHKGGGITIGPAGLENNLADRALHGTYPWKDLAGAEFGKKDRTVELLPRDPDEFFARLPRKARKFLRQRRVRSDALPLSCLLLEEYDKKRLLRGILAHLDAEKELNS